jgi:hypothetical protein
MSQPEIKATLKFPVRSQVSTEETFSWDAVRAMLDKEYMRRAEYIARIVMAMRKEYGEGVYDVVKQVIYQIGYEKGKARAALAESQGQARDLESLANLIAHKTARLYLGTTPEVREGHMVVRETYCPLPIRWREMGLTDDELVAFCMMFDQVDRGMIEGYNDTYEVELSGCRGLAEKGYCQMIVSKKAR